MAGEVMQVSEILADAVRVCTQISMSPEAKINIGIPAHVGAINFRVFSFGWVVDAEPDIARSFYYGTEYPSAYNVNDLPAFIESLRAKFIPEVLPRAEYDKAVDKHEEV
jgi:hypothetical protein